MHKTQYSINLHASIMLYLEWRNNFLTIERFAEYYGAPVQKAKRLINKGRVLHHDAFGHH